MQQAGAATTVRCSRRWMPVGEPELVKARRPWRRSDDLEIATAEWVDWYNHCRPFEYCDDLTPVEVEQAHYVRHRAQRQPQPSNR